MKFGGLLTALIILAALVGGVYWSNRAKEAADKAPPKDAAPKVLTIPEADFKTIRLQKTAGNPRAPRRPRQTQFRPAWT